MNTRSTFIVCCGVILLTTAFLTGFIIFNSSGNSCTIEIPAGAREIGANASSAGDSADFVTANNRYARDLYLQLSADPKYSGRNLVFSPFSLSSAFAIAYEGANGTTADQMRSVLHYPDNITALRKGYAASVAGLADGDRSFTLCTANALWVDKTYPVLPSFTDGVQYWYAAQVKPVDFRGQPEVVRELINTWVAQKTSNRIPDLIPPGSIDSTTRLGITNAVYFKGTWIIKFDPSRTGSAEFHVSPTKTVPVQMMEQAGEGAQYAYTETEDLQMLSMPYRHSSGKGLTMDVILPKSNDLPAAEAALDPENLSALERSVSYHTVVVYFPKFTSRSDYSLVPTLTTMGIADAFNGRADFSRMDDTRNLYIHDVIHSAWINVDEEGTEAAAATHVSSHVMASPKFVIFRADHPFIYLIRDNDTGTILFVGRVVDPTAT